MGRSASGQSALVSRLKATNAADLGTVTYVRGATMVVLTNKVWSGNTMFAMNLHSGARVEWGEIDFFVLASDIGTGEPDIGGRFTLTGGTFTGTFEIMTPETDEPPFRFSDQTRTTWRIHCKKVTL